MENTAINSKPSKPNQRMKYCAVNSSENFRGTKDAKVHMFKIPKNRELAQKWLSFLGIEPDSFASGFICNKHFKDNCLNKDKTRLLPNAAPTILNLHKNLDNDNIETIETIDTIETVDIIDSMSRMNPFSSQSSPTSPASPAIEAIARVSL